MRLPMNFMFGMKFPDQYLEFGRNNDQLNYSVLVELEMQLQTVYTYIYVALCAGTRLFDLRESLSKLREVEQRSSGPGRR